MSKILDNTKKEIEMLEKSVCYECASFTHVCVRSTKEDRMIYMDAIWCKRFDVPVAHKFLTNCERFIKDTTR